MTARQRSVYDAWLIIKRVVLLVLHIAHQATLAAASRTA